MPRGHHHGTADVHLESVEFVRHEEMHTVSLLTINIALEGNFSQVLKQIACSGLAYRIEITRYLLNEIENLLRHAELELLTSML